MWTKMVFDVCRKSQISNTKCSNEEGETTKAKVTERNQETERR